MPPEDCPTPTNCPLTSEIALERGRREVAKWVLGSAVTVALSIGAWAHARLATDAERLTRLEAQREGDRAAIEARLSEIARRLDEIRDLARSISSHNAKVNP